MGDSSDVQLFIASSAEGQSVARHLQTLLHGVCLAECWNQGAIEPGGTALDSLLTVAERADFAVIVATPDDVTVSRGKVTPAARDNIMLEYGLFAGALGKRRVYLLATGEMKLPPTCLG